jgi:hypothetical protein
MKKLTIILTLFTVGLKAQSTKDTLIYFDASDKPENMGISQKAISVYQFVKEHSDKLPSCTYSNDKKFIYFVKPFVADSISTQGRAILIPVPNDFEN